jgi:hypothetical protein
MAVRSRKLVLFAILESIWLAGSSPSFSWGSDPPGHDGPSSSNITKSDQPPDWRQSWDKAHEEVPAEEEMLPALEIPITHPASPQPGDAPVGKQNPEDQFQLHLPQIPSPPPGAPDATGPYPIESPAREGNGWGDWLRGVSWQTSDTLSYNLHLVWEDYLNYYSYRSLGSLALGIAAAAPLANTSADRSIRDWYQNKVRDPSVDHYALSVKYFGEYTIALPVYFGAALGGKALEGIDSLFSEDGSFISEVGLTTNEWGKRCIRALAVGTPMVGVFQEVLGSTRPTLGSSHWNPFYSSHGVSGHAYIGSIPFLTAASMTDSPYLRVPLFLGSFLAGWSRIHTDDHYFSQVILGWWMGFLAVRSVNQTQEAERPIEFIPGFTEGPGVSMLLRY